MIASEVLAGWGAFTRPLEGCTEWPILDVKGIPTVGLGCAILTLDAFLALPWIDDADGLQADSMTLHEAWATLRALPAGRVARSYQGATSIHLPDAAIDALARGRLTADVAVLERRWPALSTWHPAAVAGLCSLVWAVGPGDQKPGLTSPEWPHLQEALDAEDWTAAAEHGQLRAEGNPGVVPRNLATAALFLLAAGVPLDETRATWPTSTPEEQDAAARAGRALDGLGLGG